jgi:hypothetical protein
LKKIFSPAAFEKDPAGLLIPVCQKTEGPARERFSSDSPPHAGSCGRTDPDFVQKPHKTQKTLPENCCVLSGTVI